MTSGLYFEGYGFKPDIKRPCLITTGESFARDLQICEEIHKEQEKILENLMSKIMERESAGDVL